MENKAVGSRVCGRQKKKGGPAKKPYRSSLWAHKVAAVPLLSALQFACSG